MSKDFTEWPLQELSDVCLKITDGAHYSPQTSIDGLPIATVENMMNSSFDLASCRRISKNDFEDLKRNSCHPLKGDVLFSKDGTIGKTFVFSQNVELVLLSSIAIIRTNTEKLDPRFCSFFLESPIFYTQLESKKSGSALKRVVLGDIKKIKIPLPVVVEQKKIAEILTSVDRVIELTEAEIEKLKNLKKGMMQDLLTKGVGHTKFKDSPVGRIPESWELKELSDLGEIVRGLTYSPANVQDTGTLVFRSSNVQDGRISFDDNVYVDTAVESECLSRPGDILICVRNGSQALIGKSAVIPEKVPKATHGAFMTIFRGERNHFVKYLIQSGLFFKHVGLDIGATINSINTGNLKKYKFAIPPVSEQDKISECLEGIDSKIDIQKSKFIKCKNLKKSLMQDLLTGKVRVKV